MSFGINGPDRIPSIQKSHQTTDGGAGNLGYFQQGKKKKDEKEEMLLNLFYEASHVKILEEMSE